MINLLLIILGLVFGSFIAAYSYRYPRGLKISKGTSFCDKCKRQINWYENIPVLSYIVLGGKCKTCKKKISPRYPIIELLTSLSFITIYYFQGDTLQAIYSILILFLLEMIFIIDLEHQIIPDDFVFVGIFIAFVKLLFFDNANLFPSIFSGLTAATFMALIFLFTKGRGMGLGDVKFAVLGGILVGISNLFVWLLLAFIIGAIVGIILIIVGNAKLKDKIAFGPFLVISIPIALTWGQQIMSVMGYNLY